MTNFKGTILSHRKLFAVILSLFLSISILLVVSINYSKTKTQLREQLEETDFEITKIDILGANDKSLQVEILLFINHNLSSSVSDEVKIQNVNVDLFNESDFVTSFTLKIGSDILTTTSESIPMELSIDISDNSPQISSLIDKIILAEPFSLNFTGNIDFKIGRFFSDNLNFDNSMEFSLTKQKALDVQINNLDFVNKDSIESFLDFYLFNPFSSTFELSGFIDVYVNKLYLGHVNLSRSLDILQGNSSYSVQMILPDVPIKVMEDILKLANFDVYSLITMLEIKFDDLSIPISPIISIDAEPDFFEINISKINHFDTNLVDGIIDVNLDLSILSLLPITLNFTSISFTISTLSNLTLDSVIWVPESTIIFEPYAQTTLSNVSLRISDLNLFILLIIATDNAFSIMNGSVEFYLFGSSFFYNFTIDNVSLPENILSQYVK